MSLIRTSLSVLLIFSLVVAGTLLWVALFSQCDWLADMGQSGHDSPFITRVRMSSLYVANNGEILSVTFWNLKLDSYMVSSDEHDSTPITPREPQLAFATTWLSFGSLIPLVHLFCVASQLMGVFPLSRNFDVIQFWLAVSSVFVNCVGFGTALSYMNKAFNFESYGAGVYLESVAIVCLMVSTILSAVRIKTSTSEDENKVRKKRMPSLQLADKNRDSRMSGSQPDIQSYPGRQVTRQPLYQRNGNFQ